MTNSPETKNNLDHEPQPATPQELEQFKILVHAKVHTSRKAVPYHDPNAENVKIIAVSWIPAPNMDVHADIGTVHEPDYVDVLINQSLGRVQGIHTIISKHFRYFPIAKTSEYDEELAEYNEQGRRLIGEEIQRAKEKLMEVDEEQLEEEKRLAIEHAREFERRHKGSDRPELTRDNLDEVIAALARCNPSNAEAPPQFIP